MRRIKILAILGLAFLLTASLSLAQIRSPKDVFGFEMGADYKLVRWDKMVEYFKMLDVQSDRVKVVELGKTTMGNPFIMVIISSKENLANLDKYKRIQRMLADPTGLSDARARKLAKEGKVVVLISCNIHSTEIASSQMSLEFAYQLATDNSPKTKRILNDVILLLIPSHNPDGQIMVVDWYNKWLGTQYEGCPLPWLYHKYVGHDNNRDAYMLTQKETRLVNDVLYKEWFPEIVLDEHQMGNRGARLFIPPMCDPINPNINPLIWREMEIIGAHMATDLEAAGCTGVVNFAYYTGWWEGAFLQSPWWHNIVGLLSEAASVRIASPIFQKKDELRGARRGLPTYAPHINFPHPWEGGWWRLRDIVRYELIISYSLLDTASRYKEEFKYNYYLMGKDAIEKGKKEPPFAFLIPKEQWDPPVATKMLTLLKETGVKIHKAKEPFTIEGITYPAGTYVILTAQPYGRYVKDLLEPQSYPDIRVYPGGPPLFPYDLCGWTLPYQMGVKVVPINSPLNADLVPVHKFPFTQGRFLGKGKNYIFSHKLNNSAIAINRLLKAGYKVYFAKERLTLGKRSFAPGAVIVAGRKGASTLLSKLAKELSLTIFPFNRSLSSIPTYRLKPLRIALYQPWTANMDEGWTRWLLEQYEFPYTTIHNAEIKAGDLKSRYDVIIIPDMSPERIIEGRKKGTMPPQYCGGIGTEGVENLKTFVDAGGTIIALDTASLLFIGKFGLPVVNVVEKIKPDKFFCPGSILEIEVNNNHPIAYGMPGKTAAVFRGSPVFKVLPSFNLKPQVVAKYPNKNPLMSGWLIGPDYLKNKAALVEVPIGKGRVILIGFRCQHRAQPHGTFKLLFNSIYYGCSSSAAGSKTR